ncbi:MAG: transglutaminase-like domain-containing protein [Rhodospirillales bacterium]|nr:transglutaminase-like domain-containing protein [Rhodospirillales bacterium]
MSDLTDILVNLNIVGSLEDGEIDLAGVALLLGALDHPDKRVEQYRDHLAGLAGQAKAVKAQATDVHDRAAVLHDVVFADGGYLGDTETYDDTDNANLMRVIDRRRGIPVSLGIILIHVARALQWDIAGINFPGHFLLRLQAQGESAIIDPFDGARMLQMSELKRLLKDVYGTDLPMKPDFVRSVGNRDILLRLQNNIKTRALQQGDTSRAVEVLRRMALIAPGHGETNIELAALEAGQGNLKAAVMVLEDYIALGGAALNDRDAERMLDELKRGLN